jgi:hypothetical protein
MYPTAACLGYRWQFPRPAWPCTVARSARPPPRAPARSPYKHALSTCCLNQATRRCSPPRCQTPGPARRPPAGSCTAPPPPSRRRPAAAPAGPAPHSPEPTGGSRQGLARALPLQAHLNWLPASRRALAPPAINHSAAADGGPHRPKHRLRRAARPVLPSVGCAPGAAATKAPSFARGRPSQGLRQHSQTHTRLVWSSASGNRSAPQCAGTPASPLQLYCRIEGRPRGPPPLSCPPWCPAQGCRGSWTRRCFA